MTKKKGLVGTKNDINQRNYIDRNKNEKKNHKKTELTEMEKMKEIVKLIGILQTEELTERVKII